jgi:predicted dehydrogenase
MDRGNLSRRGFMTRSLGGLCATGLPLWYAQEIVAAQEQAQPARRIGPNDRIVMAAIGTGTNRTHTANLQPTRGERGFAIMRDAMGQQNVQMIAVCDVDRPNAEYAANAVRSATQGGSRECRIFSDFRDVLQNRDIDAVTIATPDHWHALVAVAAMKAGKDVYCEKPLTLTLNEGKIMAQVSRQTGKVLQTGSQQRSDDRFRLACELVRNGRIGRIARVTTLIGDNPVGGPFPAQPVPEGLDWNFWLGRTPQVDYTTHRCHYDFRWWYDYSGGKMTDWGAHHNDIAQWGLGMDDSGPVSVNGRGTPPPNDPTSYNCHHEFEINYVYGNGPSGADGTRLICRSGPAADFLARDAQNRPINNGILFEGEDGKWIFVNRQLIKANDGDHKTSRLITEPLAAGAIRLPVAPQARISRHMANFVECMRSRQQPIANVNVGHRSVSVCHLGTIGMRFFPGQTLRWNPQEQQFTGAHAEQANSHLDRPYRAPWRLEA